MQNSNLEIRAQKAKEISETQDAINRLDENTYKVKSQSMNMKSTKLKSAGSASALITCIEESSASTSGLWSLGLRSED
jgi:hypothetical protein